MVQRYATEAKRYDCGLIWLPHLDAGFYEVANEHYDDSYFDHYAALEHLPISDQIIDARLKLVERHTTGRLLDFGIGSGTFIRHRSETVGFDINEKSVAWLNERGLYVDPWATISHAVTFWDSIEHVRDFAPLLANIQEWVFISIPIFSDAQHVLRSKHFKPAEHYWYFTPHGLAQLMRDHGFLAIEVNHDETNLGREDIMSFAFKREHAR